MFMFMIMFLFIELGQVAFYYPMLSYSQVVKIIEGKATYLCDRKTPTNGFWGESYHSGKRKKVTPCWPKLLYVFIGLTFDTRWRYVAFPSRISKCPLLWSYIFLYLFQSEITSCRPTWCNTVVDKMAPSDAAARNGDTWISGKFSSRWRQQWYTGLATPLVQGTQAVRIIAKRNAKLSLLKK